MDKLREAEDAAKLASSLPSYPAGRPAWQSEVLGWPRERRQALEARAREIAEGGTPMRGARYLAWDEMKGAP